MKLTHLIVSAGLGVAGYQYGYPVALNYLNKAAAVDPATYGSQTPAPASAQPVDFGPDRTVWKREELVLIRGSVVGSNADGLLVVMAPAAPDELYNGAGSLGEAHTSSRAAAYAIEKERRAFGPTLMLAGTRMQEVSWSPPPVSENTVLLRDIPTSANFTTGRRIKVVAAPMGGRSSRARYTVRFVLDEGPGAWMRMNGGSLNRGAYGQKSVTR